jgi:UDP-N-acetylmuramoyl-L-alanyl-D-glutamate--2,6-diaminopimelate ligase
MGTILYYIKKLIPGFVLRTLRPPYHYALSYLAALRYGFPSREIIVIGVTGTKGKSSVTEIVSALFEADGKRTALAGTIRFKLGERTEPNLHKMTMPGRFFVQKFIRDAVQAECDVVILEMTSEGVKQFRHKWIDLDALIFTNLSPEHIESHGSFEKYIEAKLKLAHLLEESCKRPRRIIANADDPYGAQFLAVDVDEKIPYSLKDPELHTLTGDGASIVMEGMTLRTPLVGLFNVYNTLAAIACARSFDISLKTIEKGLASLAPIRGRVEKFESPQGAHKHITAVVDYAHTPDSLEKLYQAFGKEKKICVLGNTGGGRDTWKRPEMGRIAGDHCDHVILTNEDPYDENPHAIVKAMADGIKDQAKVSIIMDRREAIREALRRAPDNGVVLISGKGTDPYIMGPRGTKEPWSDARVVQKEMARLFGLKIKNSKKSTAPSVVVE